VAEFKIEGRDTVFANLRLLQDKLIVRATRNAANRAMRPVREQARAGWKQVDDPTSAANIPKNVALSSRYDTRRKEVKARVGIRGGGVITDDPAGTGHWRFIELGTSEIAATPIMRQALESNVGRVSNTFFDELEKEVVRGLK